MPGQIGILVDRSALRRALQGYPTHEHIALYREIALTEGIDIVVFAVSSINLRSNMVRGYMPTADGWKMATVPIPKVVHKRVLYHTSPPLKVLNDLYRRGTVFVNPHCMQNKYAMYELLSCEASVAPHLPPTWCYRWYRLTKQLDSGHTMILKPVIGSVGRGILRIAPLPKRYAQVTGKSTRVLSRSRMRRYLNRQIHPGNYLLQQYLNLVKYNGNPFDIRVPVQRDETGKWTVPGMVAKVAGPHPFLTNLAQGGHVIPGEVALNSAFPLLIATAVHADIVQLALNVAQAVAREYPYAADLGLDIGIDDEGKPWLIEVNSRDQRITFFEAGLQDAFRTLYRNPLTYCAHLSQALNSTTP